MENNNEKEVFKDIDGYFGEYQISNFGRIKSLSRKVKCRNGVRTVKEKILKQKLNTNGYYSVQLKNGGKQFLVHRLVGLMFIDNELKKPQINHIDGNKINNNIENLEWCNQSENQIHAYKIGLQIGKSLKLSEHQRARKINVLKIDGKLFKSYNCIKECSIDMNLKYSSITRVLYGKRKKYHNLIFEYSN